MADWLNDLSFFEQFYYATGFVSLFLMGAIATLIVVGIDPITRKIVSSEQSNTSGLRFLSFHTLAAFLLGYGWGGIICLRVGLHEIVVLLLSLILGLIFMSLMYLLLVGISGLNSRDPAGLHAAIGAIGEVYSTIPSKRSGAGKVRVKVGDDTVMMKAETSSITAFKPGEQVRIVSRISGSLFLVREK